ncbi:hypothetical protein [Trinickia diaoshuihuensis]|nr:hypothetical protein [Trinickia diaoshuihuensis]
MEEIGYRIENVFQTFMSPGSVAERLNVFVGPVDRLGAGFI